ncbi:cupin domain-containing protein [Paenarthrobacter sp. NPDC058040]|uniref:cupin domain-containing protein n=1 Tax=unclassified Paenarthrobacter TaxID=2634190 RepID=UPI0036DCFD15
MCGETNHAVSGKCEFVTLQPGTEEWTPAYEYGINIMNVHGDPHEEGLYVIRIKWPANVMSLPHHHPEDRHITVLTGTWYAGTGETFDPDTAVAMGPGSYMFHPAGAVHWDGSKDEETVIEIVGYGPSQLIPTVKGPREFSRV